MVLEIYIIRHAETDFNKVNSGFYQHDDMELNEYGKAQVQCLKDVLSNIDFDIIYSSDLPRVKQTTKILFENKTVIHDARLREYSHGTASPESSEWKIEYERLLKQGIPKEEIRPFGGENIWDLIKRIHDFLHDLEKQHGKIAIISHAGAISAFINLSQRRKKQEFLNYKQDNACVNRLILAGGSWQIHDINNTDHLNSLVPEIFHNISTEKLVVQLKDFIKLNTELDFDKLYVTGNLLEGKLGVYKRVFRRYFAPPLQLVCDDLNHKSNKVIRIAENFSEYELGQVLFDETIYKVNLIVANDLDAFLSEFNAKKFTSITAGLPKY